MTDLPLAHSDSIHVDRTPEEVYALVSDVTRTAEWSQQCVECSWDDDGGPAVGATFTGTNEVPGRTWTTRSTVVAADPGVEFAWEVGAGFVFWGYRMAPDGDGTTLTESWKFLDAGLAFFAETYGDEADAQIADRARAAHTGIPPTLAAIKQVAERGVGSTA
ncbi:SRPBCC family protein [Aeromicrobium sp. CF3.5]|uniref:SRPBCC family protein n=1 Tax=Aeromicrobium sp. CF3.5 TaxID=3373078 RepID=UPI003EE5DC29